MFQITKNVTIPNEILNCQSQSKYADIIKELMVLNPGEWIKVTGFSNVEEMEKCRSNMNSGSNRAGAFKRRLKDANARIITRKSDDNGDLSLWLGITLK